MANSAAIILSSGGRGKVVLFVDYPTYEATGLVPTDYSLTHCSSLTWPVEGLAGSKSQAHIFTNLLNGGRFG